MSEQQFRNLMQTLGEIEFWLKGIAQKIGADELGD